MPSVRTEHLLKETDEVFAYLPMDRQRYTPNSKSSINNDSSSRPLTPLTQATNKMTATSELARTIKETGPTGTGPTRTPSKRSTFSCYFRWPMHRSSLTPVGEQHYYASLMAACPRRAEAYIEASSPPPLKEVAARPFSSQNIETKGVLGSPSRTSATLAANSKDPSNEPKQPRTSLRASLRAGFRTSLGTSVDMKPMDFGDGNRSDKVESANESRLTSSSHSAAEATDNLHSPSTQISNQDFAKQSPATSFYPGIGTLLSNPFHSDNAGPSKSIQVPTESPLPIPSDRSSETPDRKHIAPRHFARPLPDSPTPLYLSRPRIHFDGSPRARVPKDKATGDVSLQASKYAALLVGSEDGRRYVPFPSQMFPQGPPPTCPTPPAPDGTSGIQHNLCLKRIYSISAKHTHITEALESRSMEALDVPSMAGKALLVPGRPNDSAWDVRDSDNDRCGLTYGCVVAPLTPKSLTPNSLKTPPKAAHVTRKILLQRKAAQDAAIDGTRKLRDHKMALEAQKLATSSDHPKHAQVDKTDTTVGLGINDTLGSKHAGTSNEPKFEIPLAKDGQNSSDLVSSKISDIEEESVAEDDNNSVASPLAHQGSQSRTSKIFEKGKEPVVTEENNRPSPVLVRESALTRRISQSRSSKVVAAGKEPVSTDDSKRGSLLPSHERSQSRSSKVHDAEKEPLSTLDTNRDSTSRSRGWSQYRFPKIFRTEEKPAVLDSQKHAASLRARYDSLTKNQRTPTPEGIGRIRPSELAPYGRSRYVTSSESDTEEEPVATDHNKRNSTHLTHQGGQSKYLDTPTPVGSGRLRPSDLAPYGRSRYVSSSESDTEEEPVATDHNKRNSTHLTHQSSQSEHKGTPTPVGAGRLRPSDSATVARHQSVRSTSSTAKHTSFTGPHEEPTSTGKRVSFVDSHEEAASTANRSSLASAQELQRENSRLRAMLQHYQNGSQRPPKSSNES